MYIYKFLNVNKEVIYIGRTNNIQRRIQREHFTPRGHLPPECYEETKVVQYAEVRSENESKVYELYLINQYMPKYNNRDTGGGQITFPMPNLLWHDYIPDKRRTQLAITKKELEETLQNFGRQLEQEYTYMLTYLRGKDNVEWLNKLDDVERNEYLGMIYTLERFVNGIGEIKENNLSRLK